MIRALRVGLALEFAFALGAWAVGCMHWACAGLVATGALTTLMLSWDDARAVAGPPPSERRA
jgi:hypothetical protein